ncbi:MAG: malonyl-CoA decarboxylase [Pseudomonadota bacterium]
MNNSWFFQDLMTTVAERGRQLLPAYLFRGDSTQSLQNMVDALMSGRGEASGVAIAHQLLRHYRLLDDDAQRSAFFRYVATRLTPDPERIISAADAYAQARSETALASLQAAVESPRQEFFRRLNLAPGGTQEIVHMREDLLRLIAEATNPEHAAMLTALDRDVVHLLQSWFNRGFLVLRRIDWDTPAAILEKIIAYEAVHAIAGWDDLRRRLDPVDRRCFAFFHPSLVDDPLIFVEVALTDDTPSAIASLLAEPAKPADGEIAPTTAVFYSISNCQAGLRGISFGSFLIKQVVEDLLRDHSGLKTFVTLSPVPRFARWLAQVRDRGETGLTPAERESLAAIDHPDWYKDEATVAAVKPLLQALAARYFLVDRSTSGNLIDPVGRFHLGNGARLERVNVLGDQSPKGLLESHGVMVNYLYEPKSIEQNHETFANAGTVVVSRSVRGHLRQSGKETLKGDAAS